MSHRRIDCEPIPSAIEVRKRVKICRIGQSDDLATLVVRGIAATRLTILPEDIRYAASHGLSAWRLNLS
jgi:hypothetical protein